MTYYEQTSNMLTTGEAACLLNVHPNTVRRWSNQRVIKAYHSAHQSSRRFRQDEIVGFFLKRAFNNSTFAIASPSLPPCHCEPFF